MQKNDKYDYNKICLQASLCVYKLTNSTRYLTVKGYISLNFKIKTLTDIWFSSWLTFMCLTWLVVVSCE